MAEATKHDGETKGRLYHNSVSLDMDMDKAGQPVEVGDRITLQVTLVSSGMVQTLAAEVRSLPSTAKDCLAVSTGLSPQLYPYIKDVSYVEWRETKTAPTYSMELSDKEVDFLTAILTKIGGSPFDSPRKHQTAIMEALEAAGGPLYSNTEAYRLLEEEEFYNGLYFRDYS